MLANNEILDAGRIRGLRSEVVDSHLCKMDQLFYADATCAAVPTSISLDAIDILCDNGTGYREGLHNYRHIRANPSDDVLITLPMASHVSQVQSGRVADFRKGSFAILSTARHCKISTRHLRNVFSKHDSRTVVSFIRDERLARCRDDLLNPALAGKPIANVAMAWGFCDPTYFSKVYRRRFSTTPTQDRKE